VMEDGRCPCVVPGRTVFGDPGDLVQAEHGPVLDPVGEVR
jgi:hypothetical protein